SGIRGTITADGSRVAGAKVTGQPMGRDQLAATAPTGAGGTYDLGAGDDTVRLTVAAVGWQTTDRLVVVNPNLTPTINVALDPEVPLTGVLYDGGAVHPATVLASIGSSKVIASAETRPDGSFTIGGLGTQPV